MHVNAFQAKYDTNDEIAKKGHQNFRVAKWKYFLK